jgi:hypothetical protein
VSGQTLADFSFPAFMFASGALIIIAPFEAREGQPQISRWWGLVFMFLGGMNLLLRPSVLHERGYLFAFAGLAFLTSLYLLLIEPRLEARKLRRYEAELSRAALAADEYSESLRAFHANSPFTQRPLRRWLGILILILFGATWLALGLMDGGR